MADTAGAADAATVDKATLQAAAQANKEWSRTLVFDASGNVIVSSFSADPAEVQVLLHAFDNRDATIGDGLTVEGLVFDVHRHYEFDIYGRRGDSGEGEGIGLHKIMNQHTGKPMYMLITYGYPMLSARAIPMLQEFCKKYLATYQA
eukprot:TRINITY_DN13435_c0_g1_i1.p1 TRINITY_DN13435_c0_g1~~TRINITY_DN13435_c0_g1_i1.p1  ORF type:complete len:160 (+),score=29.92 TRINITY_DN13435_c0_g1_i1:41-481(+)